MEQVSLMSRILTRAKPAPGKTGKLASKNVSGEIARAVNGRTI